MKSKTKPKPKAKKFTKKEALALQVATVKNAVSTTTEFFHNDARATFASHKVNGHTETWPIRSEDFKRVLRHHFYKAAGFAIPDKDLKELLNHYEAKAEFDGVERPVFLRVGTDSPGDVTDVYIDLCDSDWACVHIQAGKPWEIVTDAPIRFIRKQGMLPLPRPVKDHQALAHLDDLLAHLDKDGRVLCKGFLLGCLNPKGPYPLMLIVGEQGTGKSTVSKEVRALIDPSQAPTTTAPTSERDLQIAASKSWLQAYENLSSISQNLSDALCRLATGGGLRTRKLYTDDAEQIFNSIRPILINSIIDALINTGDLADRALVVHTSSIPDGERLTESAIWQDFNGRRAGIFGALCHAVSVAIGKQSAVDLHTLPRMADFAKWCIAGETGLGLPAGTFLKAYTETRTKLSLNALEASAIYEALIRFSDSDDFPKTGVWKGDVTELLRNLEQLVQDNQKTRDFPRSARDLRAQLNRITPLLRPGLIVEFVGLAIGTRRSQVKISVIKPVTKSVKS